MTSISIIGTGNMASALAERAIAGGNTVEVIGRDTAKAKELAAALGGAPVGTYGTSPAGDIVILAVPYASIAALLGEYGDALNGKVIVDITNPVSPDLTGFVTPDGSSGTQEIAKAAPAGAHVVKAFNTLFANVLAAGSAEGRPLDVFFAGDDAHAKARVSAFIESLGLRPMDAGPLPMARALENAGLLEISLANNSVTGGTGHSGSYIISELIAAGHEVTGLARSDESAAALSALGATVLRGSLEDLDGLKAAAADSDGVIHVAHRQDLLPSGGMDAVAAAELPIMHAYGEALAGTGKPLVAAGSIGGPGHGLGRPATEEDPALSSGDEYKGTLRARNVVEHAVVGLA
jgi:predicted dinucleotide-binding enzyme